ncbi:MAG: dTMP kinase [Gammaproteobacteria bacterium]|jgi:dTMP kinase
MTGKFIVLEGIEGVGKTTNMEFICRYLTDKHLDVVRTREPGGTPLAEKIRDIVLHTKGYETLSIDAELLLMFAARAQHIAQIIQPALSKGQWLVSDRFTDASYAYQGGGRGIAHDRIAVLEKWVQNDLQPDRVIILDAPVDVALLRTQHRKVKDRIEQEQTDFFVRVRQAYLQRAELNPSRYRIVNAAESLSQVQAHLRAILDELINEA